MYLLLRTMYRLFTFFEIYLYSIYLNNSIRVFYREWSSYSKKWPQTCISIRFIIRDYDYLGIRYLMVGVGGVF